MAVGPQHATHHGTKMIFIVFEAGRSFASDLNLEKCRRIPAFALNRSLAILTGAPISTSR